MYLWLGEVQAGIAFLVDQQIRKVDLNEKQCTYCTVLIQSQYVCIHTSRTFTHTHFPTKSFLEHISVDSGNYTCVAIFLAVPGSTTIQFYSIYTLH